MGWREDSLSAGEYTWTLEVSEAGVDYPLIFIIETKR
jgi:hypothetical protein